jgi:hypothetical protein
MFSVRESFANADASGTIVKIGPGKGSGSREQS